MRYGVEVAGYDQAAVDQFGEDLHDVAVAALDSGWLLTDGVVAVHGHHVIDVRRPGERGEAFEQATLALGQQVVGPVDGRAQGLVAFG